MKSLLSRDSAADWKAHWVTGSCNEDHHAHYNHDQDHDRNEEDDHDHMRMILVVIIIMMRARAIMSSWGPKVILVHDHDVRQPRLRWSWWIILMTQHLRMNNEHWFQTDDNAKNLINHSSSSSPVGDVWNVDGCWCRQWEGGRWGDRNKSFKFWLWISFEGNISALISNKSGVKGNVYLLTKS